MGSDDEFVNRITAVRGHYWGSKAGVRFEEFKHIMENLGLAEVAMPLFHALDDSDGLFPRGSGVVDALRLVDGMSLLAGRCQPDERVKLISANPQFLPNEVPARLRAAINGDDGGDGGNLL